MRHVLLSLSYLLLHSCQAQKTNPYRTYHCRIGDSPTETLVRIGDKLHHFSEELEGGSGRAVRKQRELNESGLFRALQDKMGSEHDRDVEGEDLVETTTYILTDKGGDSSQNALQSHESEAQFVEYEEGENDQFFKVKACDCKSWLMDQEAYCPADFDHCSVSSEWWGNHVWVNCYHETVITSYARYVWKYVAVIFAMLTLIFCCSRPGHNGIKYFLSFCFPSLNRWIVEEILQNEIAVRNRRQNEVAEIWRRNLREQGYVTGYKLKTKVYRYSAKTTFRESDCDNDDDDDDDRGRDFAHPSPDEEMPPILHDDNNDEPLRQSSNRETSPFVSSSTVETNLCGNQENVSPEDDDQDEDIQTCSICLLSFEDGDRVADLKCNHHFHAECMSEWVKKKNKCPLCQEEGIAEEIRTFDYESVISGHLNLHDANNPNPVSNASLQNSGNGNVSGNHEENDYTMAGLPDNGNNGAGGDANSGDGDTPVERLEGDVPRFASRARRFFRRKIRPIVMGVNSADIVTT